MIEKMMKFYNEMSDFVDDTGAAIKTWASTLSGKSDDPDEYLSRQNLKKIEQILVHDRKLGKELMTLGQNLRQKDDNRKKELILAYADVLAEDIIM